MKPIPTETGTDVGIVGKWLGAAAAGALLMYLLDPERGAARRARAASAVRNAGARTGASVDHALHSAGDTLLGLKDSATSALSRGADRLHAQAAPVIERARHGAQDAAQRFEHGADRLKERSGYEHGNARSLASHNSYEADREYTATGSSGLGQWLRNLGGKSKDSAELEHRSDGPHPALVGGGMLGLLSLMRRSPGGLLLGLAGLALLMQSSRGRTYRVSDNLPPLKRLDEHGQPPQLHQGEQAEQASRPTLH